ncbi:response regulator transcription factor [Fusibacter ferrireducens]|uniref:Stage 0 sporulation protein A homolog n=1 Tax=Fusibacter ferrireducens TaxID=2785058 RepID=A0ABR9ZZR7_9FIRM|nr:response regulator [Fusibacter ferrireducens]MBF4695936.1 response regulator [Fusibacter ferrireducens]
MHKILIVDDEYFERQSLKIILNEMPEPLKIYEAENGLDALKIMDSEKIDLIFMDIKMPKMDGIEACRHIRIHNKTVAIVILTAFADFEYAREAIKVDANDYLLKPSRPEKVAETFKYIKPHEIIVPKDHLQLFKRALFKGQVKVTREHLMALFGSAYAKDNEVEVIKGILTTLLEAAECFEIMLDKKSAAELKNLSQKKLRLKESFDFIELILDKIFEKMIQRKLSPYDREIEYALNYIEFYMTKDFSLESVAEYMNISSHYFSKLFKSEVGENFIHYVTRRKIEIACEKLSQSDAPIISIAFDLGFNEANYFSKVFKKQVGQSPNEYRKAQHMKQAEASPLLVKNHSISNSKWLI